jgi:hypothetical protein
MNPYKNNASRSNYRCGTVYKRANFWVSVPVIKSYCCRISNIIPISPSKLAMFSKLGIKFFNNHSWQIKFEMIRKYFGFFVKWKSWLLGYQTILTHWNLLSSALLVQTSLCVRIPSNVLYGLKASTCEMNISWESNNSNTNRWIYGWSDPVVYIMMKEAGQHHFLSFI